MTLQDYEQERKEADTLYKKLKTVNGQRSSSHKFTFDEKRDINTEKNEEIVSGQKRSSHKFTFDEKRDINTEKSEEIEKLSK